MRSDLQDYQMPRPIRIKPSAIQPTSPIEITASRLMSVARSFCERVNGIGLRSTLESKRYAGSPMLDLPPIHRLTEGFPGAVLRGILSA